MSVLNAVRIAGAGLTLAGGGSIAELFMGTGNLPLALGLAVAGFALMVLATEDVR